eukprot:118882_1
MATTNAANPIAEQKEIDLNGDNINDIQIRNKLSQSLIHAMLYNTAFDCYTKSYFVNLSMVSFILGQTFKMPRGKVTISSLIQFFGLEDKLCMRMNGTKNDQICCFLSADEDVEHPIRKGSYVYTKPTEATPFFLHLQQLKPIIKLDIVCWFQCLGSYLEERVRNRLISHLTDIEDEQDSKDNDTNHGIYLCDIGNDHQLDFVEIEKAAAFTTTYGSKWKLTVQKQASEPLESMEHAIEPTVLFEDETGLDFSKLHKAVSIAEEGTKIMLTKLKDSDWNKDLEEEVQSMKEISRQTQQIDEDAWNAKQPDALNEYPKPFTVAGTSLMHSLYEKIYRKYSEQDDIFKLTIKAWGSTELQRRDNLKDILAKNVCAYSDLKPMDKYYHAEAHIQDCILARDYVDFVTRISRFCGDELRGISEFAKKRIALLDSEDNEVVLRRKHCELLLKNNFAYHVGHIYEAFGRALKNLKCDLYSQYFK